MVPGTFRSNTTTSMASVDRNVAGPAPDTSPSGQASSRGGPPPAASTSVRGTVELATVAETQTGTDTARATTPAGIAATSVPLGTALVNTTALAALPVSNPPTQVEVQALQSAIVALFDTLRVHG